MRKWGMIGGILAVLLAAGYSAIAVLGQRFLESSELRVLMGRKTAREVKMPAGYLPLSWHGLSVHCDAGLARRQTDSGMQELRAREIRARSNLMEMWRGKWRIERLEIAHLQAAFSEPARAQLTDDLAQKPALEPPADKESPMKMEIVETHIRETDLLWGKEKKSAGAFRGVQTSYFTEGRNLRVRGQGGKFKQAGWPEADVSRMSLFYEKPSLRVEEGVLSLGKKSAVLVTGGFLFGEDSSMDLTLDFQRCLIAPFLTGESKGKLDGSFEAQARLRKKLGGSAQLSAAGSVQVLEGELKGIAALDQIAAFTGKPEFRRLKIHTAKTNFDWNTPTLKADNFRFESEGLVSVTGDFTVKNGAIEGTFQLGAAPDVVDAFPGAREHVFTVARGGYLWTTVQIDGSLKKPKNDLKPRLVAAAQKHFAKGILAPLLKPGTEIICGIEALLE